MINRQKCPVLVFGTKFNFVVQIKSKVGSRLTRRISEHDAMETISY